MLKGTTYLYGVCKEKKNDNKVNSCKVVAYFFTFFFARVRLIYRGTKLP